MSAQQLPHAVDFTRAINLRRRALVSYQRTAGPAGPRNVALYPVQADGMMSLQPRRHAGKEIRVVVPAEGMEVQTPLRDDDGLARKLGEPGCPVQSARVGRQGLLPVTSPVERAGCGMRVCAVRAAVPVEDVGSHVVHVGATGPALRHRGPLGINGPQELEMLTGHRSHSRNDLPPGEDKSIEFRWRRVPLAPRVPPAVHLATEIDNGVGEPIPYQQFT